MHLARPKSILQMAILPMATQKCSLSNLLKDTLSFIGTISWRKDSTLRCVHNNQDKRRRKKMICSYCHQVRNETTAPCSHCGAPAAEQVQSWGQAGPENWGAQHVEQVSFNATPPANTWAIQESPQNQWNGQPEQ